MQAKLTSLGCRLKRGKEGERFAQEWETYYIWQTFDILNNFDLGMEAKGIRFLWCTCLFVCEFWLIYSWEKFKFEYYIENCSLSTWWWSLKTFRKRLNTAITWYRGNEDLIDTITKFYRVFNKPNYYLFVLPSVNLFYYTYSATVFFNGVEVSNLDSMDWAS